MGAEPEHVAAHRTPIRRHPRWQLPVLLLTLVAVTAGAANAFWTSSGDTTGFGTTGTSIALTLSPGTPTAELRPGGQGDVAATITNTNSEPVQLTSLALDMTKGTSGVSVDSAHASCDPSALTYTDQSTGWTVPARSGSVDGTLEVVLVDALSMDDTADDSCQGAVFTVHLEATP